MGVLLIHGTASSGRIWRKMLREMPPHMPARRHETLQYVAPDLPISGPDLSFMGWVEYLRRTAIGDGTGSRRFHLVGHSLGGALAMALASEEWVESAALISPATPLFCRDMGLVCQPGLRPGSIVMRRVSGSLVHDPLTLTREDAVLLRQDYERAGPLLESGLPWPGPDSIPGLGASDEGPVEMKPVLVVFGEEDKVVAPSYAARLVDDLRSNGVPVQSHPIPGCGHIPMMECPRELARILSDFWSR